MCDGTCQNATCEDGVANGGESGIDCGGPTSCPACGTGAVCGRPSDCTSGVCGPDGRCVAPTCQDQVANGAEIAVDCGGPDCPACAAGTACIAPADCASGVCGDDGLCAAATCTDHLQNGDETWVDCGGGTCAPCPAYGLCANPIDCTDHVCTDGVCRLPTCDDHVRNGTETGVDCGGDCGVCDAGQPCGGSSDCASNFCDNGYCAGLTGSGTPDDPYVTTPLRESCKAYAGDPTGVRHVQTGSYRVGFADGTTRPVYCDFERQYEVEQLAVNLSLVDTRTFCSDRGMHLAIPTSDEVDGLLSAFSTAFGGVSHTIRLDMDIQITGDCDSLLNGRSDSGAWRSVSGYGLPGNSQCSSTYHGYIVGCQAWASASGFYSAVGSGNQGGTNHTGWTRNCTQADSSHCTQWAAQDQGPFPVCSW